MDEMTMLLEPRQHVEQNVQLVEIELVLADPKTHNDNEHDFLIKKIRMFRSSLTKIDRRIQEIGHQ